LVKGAIELNKKIILFMMVLFLGAFWAQTASAQSISAQINENDSIGSCNHPNGSCTSCFSNFTFNLVWSRTPAPAGYQWSGEMTGGYKGSNGFIVGNLAVNKGSVPIFSEAGTYATSPCNQWIQQQEQAVNSQQWTVWGYLIASNGSQTLVRSNVAQLSNPYSSSK
jgi:hypothetical protein